MYGAPPTREVSLQIWNRVTGRLMSAGAESETIESLRETFPASGQTSPWTRRRSSSAEQSHFITLHTNRQGVQGVRTRSNLSRFAIAPRATAGS